MDDLLKKPTFKEPAGIIVKNIAYIIHKVVTDGQPDADTPEYVNLKGPLLGGPFYGFHILRHLGEAGGLKVPSSLNGFPNTFG